MRVDKINKIANALIDKDFSGTCSIDSISQYINEDTAIIINTHSRNLPEEH